MKYQLLGDWPCEGGSLLVPAGTVLEWQPPGAPTYRGTRLPTLMPANAMAMDQQSYDAQVAAFVQAGNIEVLINTLRYGPGVVPKRFVNGRLI